MPPARRRPRWNTGDLYAIHLTPRHDAIAQLLERDGYAAIFAVAVGAPAPSADQIARRAVYRVLFTSPHVPREATRIGRLPGLVADIPPFFTRPPRAAHKRWEPDTFDIWQNGGARPATRQECVGLEVMAVWDHWSLVDRLRDEFLRGGDVPPADDRP